MSTAQEIALGTRLEALLVAAGFGGGGGGSPLATDVLTGTVKTDVLEADPVVYTKASVDTGFYTKTAADAAFAPISHTHAGTDITSGLIAAARLGSGSGGATKFLREDQSWQTVAGGGPPALDDLTDVAITTVADKDYLRYDSGTALWKNLALTTLAGFGITNAYTKTESDAQYAAVAHTHALNDLTDVVITGSPPSDGYILMSIGGVWVDVFGDNYFAANGHIHEWTEIMGTPTTLAGYGITDAYIKTEVYTKLQGDGRYFHDGNRPAVTQINGIELIGLADRDILRYDVAASQFLNAPMTFPALADVDPDFDLYKVDGVIPMWYDPPGHWQAYSFAAFEAAFYTKTQSDARFAPLAHVHAGTDITTGVVAPARLGTGSGGATKFLREDSTFQVPAGGGGADTFVVATADQANSTVTPAAVATLTTVVGPGTYLVKLMIVFRSAATTTGIEMFVKHSGTTTRCAGTWYTLTTGGAAATGISDQATTLTAQMMEGKGQRASNVASGPMQGVDTANADQFAVLEALLIVTVSGNLDLMFRSEVAASAVTIMTGTTLVLTKVA